MMSSDQYKTALDQMIVQYRLDERCAYWRKVKLLIERGMLSDRTCKALLNIAEIAVEHQKDYPDYLHRTPTADQLYAGGEPQVRLGTILEDPSLVFGVRFDRPLFIIVAGTTGFGKTTLIRILLQAIYQFNQCRLTDPSQ
jgi:deoxyadenosine/deoxycytidine kinase